MLLIINFNSITKWIIFKPANRRICPFCLSTVIVTVFLKEVYVYKWGRKESMKNSWRRNPSSRIHVTDMQAILSSLKRTRRNSATSGRQQWHWRFLRYPRTISPQRQKNESPSTNCQTKLLLTSQGAFPPIVVLSQKIPLRIPLHSWVLLSLSHCGSFIYVINELLSSRMA